MLAKLSVTTGLGVVCRGWNGRADEELIELLAKACPATQVAPAAFQLVKLAFSVVAAPTGACHDA